MADGKPKRPQYALPDEYGPARPPRRVEEDTDPAVRTVPRDAPAAAAPQRHADDGSLGPIGAAATDPPRATRAPPARAARVAPAARSRVGSGVASPSPSSLLLIPVVWSYVHALQRPGTDSLGVRSVEWIRDNGGNGIVNTIERWWYTNNPPVGRRRARRRSSVQGTGGEVTSSTNVPTVTTMPQPAHLPPPTAARAHARARASRTTKACGCPPVASSAASRRSTSRSCAPTRRTPRTTSRSCGSTPSCCKAVYVPGSHEPGGGPNPWGSQIPEAERATLIAAFNSGFKMDSANGGVYFDGAGDAAARRRVGVARDQDRRIGERRRVGS